MTEITIVLIPVFTLIPRWYFSSIHLQSTPNLLAQTNVIEIVRNLLSDASPKSGMKFDVNNLLVCVMLQSLSTHTGYSRFIFVMRLCERKTCCSHLMSSLAEIRDTWMRVYSDQMSNHSVTESKPVAALPKRF